MDESTAIVWFRRDLRLADNPALGEASSRYQVVIPVYLNTPDEDGSWKPGAASRWWLHQSLEALNRDLQKRGSRLILRSGKAQEELDELIQATGACAVYWNRRYEPESIQRDQQIKTVLKSRGVIAESFNGALLHEPWTIATKSGKPFEVFTPFWKACCSGQNTFPIRPQPKKLRPPENWPRSEELELWKLLPRIRWDEGFKDHWTPGEAGAMARCRQFLTASIRGYASNRDIPEHAATSRLSPHLHFGEISPRQIWELTRSISGDVPMEDVEKFQTELGWREFATSVLYHFPQTIASPLRTDFQKFPWISDTEHLHRWQRGETGYPIVDAGMRELWHTGWMHNRVRMIVGSFLTKHLRINWVEGARWFWETLVDADLANNTMGWQWIAGCGADAAPYFRIFNPILQGAKFDPQGRYVRRWIPELAPLPNSRIHQPWTATPSELSSAGIELGKTYPSPIVDHAEARRQALDAFAQMRK